MTSTDTSLRHVPWVQRMLATLDHVHAHLDQDVSPIELACVAGFSPHHFHRVFRGMVGESVTIQSSDDALLGQALPRRGVELADEPTVEVTLDDPRTTPPERLRTEIRVRLA